MTLRCLMLDEFALPQALEAAWLAELPAARRAQLRAWPEARARHASLLGSRLLREGLLRLGHSSDALASLRYCARGRPTLDLPVQFSLSHCEGRVLCALSTDGPVGVDIEALGPRGAAEFGLYLSARERAWAGSDTRRFYSLWTRKEAVLKAAGSAGLRQMGDFEMLGGRTEFAGHRWHTTALAVDDGYVAHLASATPLPAPPVERIAAGGLR